MDRGFGERDEYGHFLVDTTFCFYSSSSCQTRLWAQCLLVIQRENESSSSFILRMLCISVCLFHVMGWDVGRFVVGTQSIYEYRVRIGKNSPFSLSCFVFRSVLLLYGKLA